MAKKQKKSQEPVLVTAARINALIRGPFIKPQHNTEDPVGMRKSWKNGGRRAGPKFKSEELRGEWEARAAADAAKLRLSTAKTQLGLRTDRAAKAEEVWKKKTAEFTEAVKALAIDDDAGRKKIEQMEKEVTKTHNEWILADEALREAVQELANAETWLVTAIDRAMAAEDEFRHRNSYPPIQGYRPTHLLSA